MISSKLALKHQRQFFNLRKHALKLESCQLTNRDSFSRVNFSKKFNTFSLGRILKDEQTLESYKIEDGVTVHLVKSKGATAEGSSTAPTTSATSAPTTAPQANPFGGMPGMGFPGMGGMGGMGGFPGMGMGGGFPGMQTGGGPSGMGGLGGMNPAMIQDMMSNPMVQNMLSNPAFMESMINSKKSTKKLEGGPMIYDKKSPLGKPRRGFSIPVNLRNNTNVEFGIASYKKGNHSQLKEVLAN